MDQAGRTPIGKRILGALGACLTAACASNAPYHTTSEDGGACRTDPDSPACRSSAYQEFERFDLAFAEFSERGNAFDGAKVEAEDAVVTGSLPGGVSVLRRGKKTLAGLFVAG